MGGQVIHHDSVVGGARWEQAKSGEGRVVLISAEPGIGRSRLTAALAEHIASEPIPARAISARHQDSGLYPFIAQLERAAGLPVTIRSKTGSANCGRCVSRARAAMMISRC